MLPAVYIGQVRYLVRSVMDRTEENDQKMIRNDVLQFCIPHAAIQLPFTVSNYQLDAMSATI